MKQSIPDARTQAELLIVRAMSVVIPKTFDLLLAAIPQQQATREQVLDLAERMNLIADDHELRLFLLERATPLEASLIRQSVGLSVHIVRTFPLDHDAYVGIVGRLLRGDHLIEIVRLGLRGIAGPESD